jgi:hypothetical protein
LNGTFHFNESPLEHRLGHLSPVEKHTCFDQTKFKAFGKKKSSINRSTVQKFLEDKILKIKTGRAPTGVLKELSLTQFNPFMFLKFEKGNKYILAFTQNGYDT